MAAILHLGNIEFVKGEESDAAEPKDDKSRFHLKVAAELFMYILQYSVFLNNIFIFYRS